MSFALGSIQLIGDNFFWHFSIPKKVTFFRPIFSLQGLNYEIDQTENSKGLSCSQTWLYRWTSLYARDRDSKNMLEYNEFAYKKTNDHCKLEDRFQKKAIFQSHIRKFPDKKTAYNEGRLYLQKELNQS